MKIIDIRSKIFNNYFREEKASAFWDSVMRIDKRFFSHIREILLPGKDGMSPLDSLNKYIEDAESAVASAGAGSEDTWFNQYPSKIKGGLYRQFLGICLEGKRLDTVLKKALEHSEAVAKKFEHEPYPEKTVVILTDKWNPRDFAKYESKFLYYAAECGIWYVFILVTDYGYTQIPFLPNDRSSLAGVSIDYEDAFRQEAALPDDPIIFREEAAAWGIDNEFIIYPDKERWECYSPKNGSETGVIERKEIEKFLRNQMWIIDCDESELDFYSIACDVTRYTLRIFGRTVKWDGASESHIYSWKLNKLSKEINRLIGRK